MASKHYTDAKKIEVVTTYLVLGKAPLVEAATGVPRGTIRQWKMQPWWKELESDIRVEEDQELDSKLSRIVDRTLDTVVDRIEHGDYILDSRSGTVKRVPVKMKDAHKVSVDLIDKRNLLRGKPTSRVEKITVEDTMLKLAEQFKEWAKLIKSEKVIEGDYADEGTLSEGQGQVSPMAQRLDRAKSFNMESISEATVLKESRETIPTTQPHSRTYETEEPSQIFGPSDTSKTS